jgi:radical SAM/Cys-rich protein
MQEIRNHFPIRCQRSIRPDGPGQPGLHRPFSRGFDKNDQLFPTHWLVFPPGEFGWNQQSLKISLSSIQMNAFDETLARYGLRLSRGQFQTLQLNIGRKCNQACRHCHVDAAPWRTEMMDKATAHRIAAWIEAHRPPIVDLTGGAPELSEFFGFLVETSRRAGARVLDRNNLTIIEEPGFEYLPEFLARHEVEVIASLPCYSAANVNQQRGNGVFEKSIAALRKLNSFGYGSRLILHLVYNPLGPTLPGAQAELEADYKAALRSNFGVEFNQLFTLANQPIARFAEDLRRRGQWDDYLELLANSFNPETVPGLMCRTTLSVDYRGRLFDCDFNQMLDLPIGVAADPLPSLWDITPAWLENRRIATAQHCFACTAGHGSSCTGALDVSSSDPGAVSARMN